jgi:hypothetical protein
MKGYLSNPWVVTLVGGAVVAWFFQLRASRNVARPFVEEELDLGSFRYTVTKVTGRRIRPTRWRRGRREDHTEYHVHIKVVNITRTAGRPRVVVATMTSADGRRFPMSSATGPAFEAHIFPGQSAEGLLRFGTPANLQITSLGLRDPNVRYEKSLVLRAG